MYFSDGDIKQMAWTIVTSIGERMMEEDDVLSSKQYHVGWFYTGFGLYIRIPSTTNAECAAISYNGGTVFLPGHGTLVHGEWENILHELSMKAPVVRARKDQEEANKRALEEWAGKFGNECRKYVDIIFSYHTGRSKSWTDGFYEDSDIRINVHERYVEIYRKFGFFGRKREKVFDSCGSVFIDGEWRVHVERLIERGKVRTAAEQRANTPTTQEILDQIRNL